MDRQKQYFEKLGFGPFLANLTTILFLPRKEKGDVFYASANYKVQEPNYTRPDDHRNYFEHDVIMTSILSACSCCLPSCCPSMVLPSKPISFAGFGPNLIPSAGC